eukprot:TRINITY_DN11322_c0_g1_i1.p1 TRINITY_DN11322_c0_g1~~TRINITY_DN11322_c0_g1_i1.p1  ORF type:complete len:262 (+),score=82.25 TRINITY_DN11322_c0_g1_i1:374-1159(+)
MHRMAVMQRGSLMGQLRCAQAAQQRYSPFNLKDLQETLNHVKPKEGEGSSQGLTQLKLALEQLQKEADAKKEVEVSRGSSYYIVHTTGPERLGLVAEVSAAVSTSGLDILASRATLLGGDFSMMIHVRSHDSSALGAATDALAKVPGVAVWIHDASSTTEESQTVGPGRVARVLRMSGNNTPGIISGVTRFLHKRDVVVMNLASELGRGLLGGPPQFKLRLVLDAPGHLARDEVVAGANAVGQMLGSTIKVDAYVHCDEQE